MLGFPCNYQSSSTAGCDNLCHEAITYVEERAESIYVYNVAMEALRKAAKKVAATKQDGPGVIQSNPTNRSDQEANTRENQISQLQSCSMSCCSSRMHLMIFILNDMAVTGLVAPVCLDHWHALKTPNEVAMPNVAFSKHGSLLLHYLPRDAMLTDAGFVATDAGYYARCYLGILRFFVFAQGFQVCCAKVEN
ncbi:hypothetical protein U1Q18_036134 [Sarracenia purpurea var. burkii]